MTERFDVKVAGELLAEIEAGKNKRPARMLLLAKPVEIGGITELRLYLLFAIAEIVVGDQCYDDAGFVAAGEFKGSAIIIKLSRVVPTHAVAPLAFGGGIPSGEAGFPFCDADEVRRENDAAGVASPMFGAECGIIFGQTGVAGVTEDAFDKIEITDQATRREEADFHRFRR